MNERDIELHSFWSDDCNDLRRGEQEGKSPREDDKDRRGLGKRKSKIIVVERMDDDDEESHRREREEHIFWQ